MSSVTEETPSLTKGCLYRSRPQAERRNTLSKQVSFPEDDSRLVTGYMEAPNPWEYADNFDRSQIITSYSSSCVKHGHPPSGSVLKQLEALEFNGDRCSLLDLKGELLDSARGESLEEILRRIQFISLSLEDTSLDDEGAVAIFDMIEYYESANNLNISGNQNISARGWQACSRMIKKTQCLEHLEASNMTLNEQIMPIISRSLRITTHLQVLKLENCKLSGRPIIILVGALKLNTGLRELYIADNDLGVTDALQLAALLRSNTCLQLLDISNNNIQDDGASHVVDGLIEQPSSGGGLSILVLWNNRLTRSSAPHFARALSNCRSLEMLNIGHNVLTSDVVHSMKDSLQQNKTLLRLGMQSTHLSCEGAIALAEVIEDNKVIQRIDLRDNTILMAGLLALALSMKSNQTVTQLDLDDAPKRRPPDVTLNDYQKLVSEIRGYCSRNEQIPKPEVEEEEEEVSEVSDSEKSERRVRLTSVNSRKISLTCQTLLRSVAQDNCNISGGLLAEPQRNRTRLRSPAPSPVPSPVSSPMPSPAPSPGPARNRFRVSQVSESDSLSPSPSASPSSSPTCFFPSSRFKVTVVEPPSPIVASNSVTFGFACNQQDSPSSDRETVTPDTDSEVRNIMAHANATALEGLQVESDSSPQAHVSLQQSPQRLQQNCSQAPGQPQSSAQPQQQTRSRKISWVPMTLASVTSSSNDENKAPSSLERLLGLFQNPGILFNKNPSPQPTPAQQPMPRRSPQSSPQQQRAAQPAENGLGNVLKNTGRAHPAPLECVSNDRRPIGSGSSSLRPLAVSHSGDADSVKGGRDVMNNNGQCSLQDVDKSVPPVEETVVVQKDENLNIHQAEACGGGGVGGSGDDAALSDAVSVSSASMTSSTVVDSDHSSSTNLDDHTSSTTLDRPLITVQRSHETQKSPPVCSTLDDSH
ncbi:protein phosphatase 1 regulatory subunit 37 [Thrips palmi]|uniref:Protein phosphatase 1 regulatory subunit 37 n=1 Tax=Thrips palmi TaxID=161013 RepID=A0A6P8ZUG3_THRPL|nr:protein phosphatase 1 regulatory subunit 37 [Thrips palmi]XP_034248938.1 protein phosphatase 1 regulatory subunit 37 [Thrips palmi]